MIIFKPGGGHIEATRMARQKRDSDRYFDLADFGHELANPGARPGMSMREVYLAVADALKRQSVRFVLHGAIAMAVHGYSRATGDIDFLVPEDLPSASAIRRAMAEIGAAPRRKVPRGARHMQFNLSSWILDFFRDSDFEGIAGRAKEMEYRGRWVLVISRNDLVERKLARGSALDVSDVKRLLGGGEG